MSRAIWKGAISFGLVHIPVAMHSASSSQGIDFDWLDKRSMDPVGYKRVNKVTGKEIATENIVKGIQYEKGRYVVLSEEEIRAAHPATTQTIDIFAFVDREEIPLTHIENPYYLAPDKRGEKVYALLQKTLSDTNKVALTNVVVHTKQYLAALMAIESTLVILLLRWPAEVRPLSSVELSKTTTDATFTKGEKEMAKRLVEDMTSTWNPESYHDTFGEKIMALVDKKARNGEIENVEAAPEDLVRKSADVIDLTELLKQSLRGKSDKQSPKNDTGSKAKVTSIKSSKENSHGKASTSKSNSEKKSSATKPVKAKSLKTKSAKTPSAKADETKANTTKKTNEAKVSRK
jgi:DNA end-binding protein Ku